MVLEVNRYLAKLFYTGETVCESPYYRFLIRRELRRYGVRYTGVVIGWKCLDFRYASSADRPVTIEKAFEHLERGRYDPADFMDSEARRISENTTGVNQETRMRLFSKEATDEDKYEILATIFNTKDSSGVSWNRMMTGIQNKIKKISVDCAWPARRLLYIAHGDTEYCAETFARLPAELIVLIDHHLLCA
jgi:hypothetical protein